MSLMLQAVSISEASVDLYETTLRNIQEDSRLHARRSGNLNSRYTFRYNMHEWNTFNKNLT
jgi:hypothetical protein